MRQKSVKIASKMRQNARNTFGGEKFLDDTDSWNGVLGRGCDEAEISEEKCLFTEWGPDIQ